VISVRIPFPLFALFVEEVPGVVLFGRPPLLFLPLFTSPDEINLFRRRHLPLCQALAIENPALLKSLLQEPGGPESHNPRESYRILFDPIEVSVDRETMALGREELISACVQSIAVVSEIS